MSEHLRPPESGSIGAELRTRLEGSIERLEDGLHLLDSVQQALRREPLGDDDLATLREAALQLPRLEAALAVAQQHEAAGALAHAMASRRRALEDALRGRLDDGSPSLAAGLRALIHHAHRHRAPAADETRFLEGRSGAWSALVVGAFVASVDRVGHGDWSRWWVGAVLAAVLLVLLLRWGGQWVLLGDRLHVEGANVWLSDITSVERDWSGNLTVRAGKASYSIDGAVQPLLALMMTSWLGGLGSRRTGTVHETQEGLRLVSPAGELTVLHARGALAVQSLGGRAVTLHQLFALLAHLPPDPLRAVARHLVSHADAQWEEAAAAAP